MATKKTGFPSKQKKVGNMKLYSFEELLEEDYGKIGTPERDAFERNVDEAVTHSTSKSKT